MLLSLPASDVKIFILALTVLNRDHNWDQHYDLLVEQSIRVLGFFYIGFCCLFLLLLLWQTTIWCLLLYLTIQFLSFNNHI